MRYGLMASVSGLVLGIYAYTAHPGGLGSGSLNAADNYYSLLVQGFRADQLSLKKTVPPGLAQLADPYDPGRNALYRSMPYGMHDLSYYQGKFYLYFGVTPALVLFWPYVALTGHYLFQKDATVIFCAVGFLASVGLLCALKRRYFAGVNVAIVTASTLALGLAAGVTVLLARSDVYEVAISCGYALSMLALAGVWKALHQSRKRSGCRWLAGASLAYGLAVGARPSLLFGAVILLAPLVQPWRERRPMGGVVAAAVAPISLVGLGLMLYNFLRFGNPLEFGVRYLLSFQRIPARQFFNLRYLWVNVRVYFLEPARWSSRFPFVHDIAVPPLPAGHGPIEETFGVVVSIPVVWLALAVPLAWRNRPVEARSVLCGFLAAIAALFGTAALALGLFYYAAGRYQVDFLPALMLLAVVGILSVERTLPPTPRSGLADGAAWRRAARSGWSLLLVFSLAFNALATIQRCATAHYYLGNALSGAGNLQESIDQYQQALRLKPDLYDAHDNLAIVLARLGSVPEAIGHWEQALQINPRFVDAHYNLGVALMAQGQVPNAVEHFQQALWVKPDFAEAHFNLGFVLEKLGRTQEAIHHYQQALRIKPDLVQARTALARAQSAQ
jgi:tetratricopeptide (TPR) repeat protein